ncbi:MAG: hypothetical protein KDE56_30975 [Anaerolineales bacterium]|nr:hypothetical protein [Anaerolineales bacterium]
MLRLVAFQRALWVICWVCIIGFLPLVTTNGLAMAVGEAPTAVSVFISDEAGGNNTTSRALVDTLDDSWESAAQGIGAASFELGAVFDPVAPVILQTANGFTIEVSLRNMDGNDPLVGTASGTQGDVSNSSTLQDNAPKPQSMVADAFYAESAGSSSNRNALLFTFSQPIRTFGAWFGDVETRTDGEGVPAILRLLASDGTQIGSDVEITPGLVNNVAIDQQSCGASEADDPTPGSETFIGCGNRTTRWIGFVADGTNPVKQMILIVGDDDTTVVNADGNGEHLSFIGAKVGLSPTAVSLTHLAALPTTPTPWLLLVVLLGLLGLTARLVRRGV